MKQMADYFIGVRVELCGIAERFMCFVEDFMAITRRFLPFAGSVLLIACPSTDGADRLISGLAAPERVLPPSPRP